MGIVAFNWAAEGNNQLTLVMNRDNWENRVISGASWDGNNQILSGRCQANDGTWLGISRRGRVAFLVNTAILLDRVDHDRGSELYPIGFLEGNLSPQQFAQHVATCEEERHAELDDDEDSRWSYSLIVADMTSNSMVHIRKPNQDEPDVMIDTVAFGVHTISPYDGLDSTEPRDLLVRGLFNQVIGELGNDEQVPPLNEIARRYMYDAAGGRNAVFIETMDEHPNEEALGMQRFGTTSTTLLAVKRTRGVTFFERCRDENAQWNEIDETFNIQ